MEINNETKGILLDIVNKIDERKKELSVLQSVCIQNNMDLEEKMVFSRVFEINEIRSYIVTEYLRK